MDNIGGVGKVLAQLLRAQFAFGIARSQNEIANIAHAAGADHRSEVAHSVIWRRAVGLDEALVGIKGESAGAASLAKILSVAIDEERVVVGQSIGGNDRVKVLAFPHIDEIIAFARRLRSG